MPELGKFLVVVGAIVLLSGLLIWGGFMPRWLGRLPGDIRVERGNSGFYFPIVTCVVISIVLSLIFSLFRR
jgi:membrane protein implicated in regulation of membrane protease activity